MFGKKKKNQEPQVDPREQVEAVIDRLESRVYKLEAKRQEMLQKAKLAKARGDKSSYNMARSGLRAIMQQQKQAQQMALSMGILLDMRDVQGMMGEFLSCMKTICAQFGNVPSMKEIARTTKDFNETMDSINRQSMAMDEMMTAMTESMGDMEFEGVSSNDEIDQAIDRELAMELDAEEIEIEKQLAEAKNKMAGNN